MGGGRPGGFGGGRRGGFGGRMMIDWQAKNCWLKTQNTSTYIYKKWPDSLPSFAWIVNPACFFINTLTP